MKELAFEKWEGLGNDFVVVRSLPGVADPALVSRICDRHVGVGADGILVVTHEADLPRMTVYNADGSRPEMCGNGLRCVAGYLATEAEGGQLVIATDAGLKTCLIASTGTDTFRVTAAMGSYRMEAPLVVAIDGVEHRFLTVDMGNPHAVTFEPYADAAVDTLGPHVERIPTRGTNVEFCRDGSPIAVAVWERGVGRTLACGTGACAVAAAACETGRASFDAPVRVLLPGGELSITIARETSAVTMSGPARRVFKGTLRIP